MKILFFLINVLFINILFATTSTDNTIILDMETICNQFKQSFNDLPSLCTLDPNEIKDVQLYDPQKKLWKIKFYFGFSRSKYLPTDLHLKNNEMDITVKDFIFDERQSSSFYNPKNWESSQDALRWIDEPTNTFTLVLENNNNQFFIRAFHPKFVKENRLYAKHPDQKFQVDGTIRGDNVNQYINLDPTYDEYYANDQSQVNLINLQNTHRQFEFALGYGKKINLLDMNKMGKISITPDIALGIMIGQTRAGFRDDKEYWAEYKSFEDKLSFHGLSVSTSNKIEWSFGNFKIFGDVRYHFAKIKHRIDNEGGYARYNLQTVATTVGIGFNLWKSKK